MQPLYDNNSNFFINITVSHETYALVIIMDAFHVKHTHDRFKAMVSRETFCANRMKGNVSRETSAALLLVIAEKIKSFT